jgi:hypothetical protein
MDPQYERRELFQVTALPDSSPGRFLLLEYRGEATRQQRPPKFAHWRPDRAQRELFHREGRVSAHRFRCAVVGIEVVTVTRISIVSVSIRGTF